MKIVSWNVNGIRARIKQGFEEAVAKIDPDIICLQEFRAQISQVPKSFLSSYNDYHSYHEKAGYAGTSVFVKKTLPAPVNVWNDYEGGSETGRVCILEFEDYVLISSYSPNSGRDLEKLPHRMSWERGLDAYIESLKKPVIMCGDLNVAPAKIDAGIWCKAGCSPEERFEFARKQELGLIDVFRYLYPKKVDYTWFSNFQKEKIKGLRLDEFLISKSFFKKKIDITHIHSPALVCGSDHVPIVLEVEI